MKTALIDADALMYRASASVQSELGAGGVTAEMREENSLEYLAIIEMTLQRAESMLERWRAKAGCDEHIMAFSSADRASNWRRRILPTYKANRTAERPIVLLEAILRMRERHKHYVIEGLEADDLLGLMLTGDRHKDQAVLVSIDKDMLTLPGQHFNPLRAAEGVVTVRPREAIYRWMLQTATGDPVDGYSGIPRIGIKKAVEALGAPGAKSLESMWASLCSLAAARGMRRDALLTQARVARILRSGDYDKTVNRVRLWHPHGSDEWIHLTMENDDG